MKKIAIVGTSSLGVALAKVLLSQTDNEVVFIDASEAALQEAYEACAQVPRSAHSVALMPTVPVESFVATGKDQTEATLKSLSPNVVVNAGPETAMVAEIASRLQANYLDFNSKGVVLSDIIDLGISRTTFVPRTGLFPGLSTYIALSLAGTLQGTKQLDIRGGVLPQASIGPYHFTLYKSAEETANEYLTSIVRKVQGLIEQVVTVDEVETLIANGTVYECFTAGDLGDLSVFAQIPSVEFKSIRFPGHADAVQKLLSKVDFNLEDSIDLINQTFQRTKDDVVVLVVQAVDIRNTSTSTILHFYPCEPLELSAYDFVSGGTAAAVIELILSGSLPAGVISAADIDFDALMNTSSMRMVFEYSN